VRNDSIFKTLFVALTVCIICSVVVSTTAVLLKPTQDEQKAIYEKKNILLAAGVVTADEMPADSEIDGLFENNVEEQLIEFATGEIVPADKIDPATFDARRAAKDPTLGEEIPDEADVAKIRRMAKYSKVYLKKTDGKLDRIVLPVHGKGLWSTMYGFLALDADGKTVKSISFYEDGETPGLGGEINNPNWQEKWIGKLAFNEQGEPSLEVVKGNVTDSTPNAQYKVDGLSGATITARGVGNMVEFWLGEQGYGPYLDKLRESGQLREGGQS
jgi:Na+-transporting NADH:ubiquinone oxidoreductase subunit C